MRKKINPNLLRQKITQIWINNFYIQKPYKIENIFIKTYKILYLIKIFLTTFRNLKLFIKNKKLKKKIKKINYNIIEISNYKLLNTFYEKNQNKFLFFCNIVLRNNFYTVFKLNTFEFKTILFNLNKKLKKINFNKKKNIFFFNTNIKKAKALYKFLKYKTANKKNLKIKFKKLFKIVFKPLLKYKKINKKYFYFKKKTIKIKINKKTILKKNKQYISFWNKNIKKLMIIKRKKKVQKNIKNIYLKNTKKLQHLITFIYSQLYKNILENNLQTFFQNQKINLKNTQIILQLVQNFPIIKKNLDELFKKIINKKPQLKKNMKTFKKLFFLFPSFSIFYLGHLINEQFAFELAKTKKHWKIIKTLELFLIQYLNANAEYLEKNLQISGIKIIITGRPNKSSRTQKIQLKFGLNKQTKIETINLTKSFYTANAKIGNFGITFLINL